MLLNILFTILGIILGYFLFTFISLRKISKLNESLKNQPNFIDFLDKLDK